MMLSYQLDSTAFGRERTFLPPRPGSCRRSGAVPRNQREPLDDSLELIHMLPHLDSSGRSRRIVVVLRDKPVDLALVSFVDEDHDSAAKSFSHLEQLTNLVSTGRSERRGTYPRYAH